jgi:LytS/YehU family sensor histidine kinase
MYPRVPPPPADLPDVLERLGVGSVTWFAAAIALPLLVWGARRADVARLGWRRAIALSSVVLVSLAVLTGLAEYVVTYRGASSRPGVASFLASAARVDLLAWLAVAGLVVAVEARRRAAHDALERERLRAQVAEQQLIALTGQLQPHFLFNTLQGISTLIHRDADAADEMLNQLSDLLRDLLRHRDSALVPLGDEVRRTSTYLDIARHRFGDRLAYEIDVPVALHDATVPLFILQPLVENALSHGIGGRMRGGRITLSATRVDGRLQVEIADDGAGLAGGAAPTERVGLTNTRQRLHAAFGDDQRLTLEPRPTGGAVARLDLPYRTLSLARASARA